VTEEKAQREQLLQRALHDGLTGLANRQSFDERLMNAIARASSSGRPLAVAMLDLDGFKGVNDSHGHAAGDQLLQVIGQRLGNELRIGDAVARLGGDEFGVLLESVRTHDEMADIFDRLVAAIESPVSIGGLTLQVGCSIGIGWYPWHGADGAALLHHADAAMYAAKSRKPSPGNDRGSPRGREAEEARMATA
jgi:diguanylate cyclase (GGDEF)-like protein